MLYADRTELIKGEDTEHFNEGLCKAPQGRSRLFLVWCFTTLRTAQGPAPGKEQPHVPVQARGGPAGEQLCGEGPGCAGG